MPPPLTLLLSYVYFKIFSSSDNTEANMRADKCDREPLTSLVTVEVEEWGTGG